MLTNSQIHMLIRALCRQGFRLGADTALQTQQLQWSLQAHSPLEITPEHLGPYLAPVLCRSPEEQAWFQRFYPDWLQGEGQVPAGEPESLVAPPVRESPDKEPAARRPSVWSGLLIILLLVFLGLYYFEPGVDTGRTFTEGHGDPWLLPTWDPAILLDWLDLDLRYLGYGILGLLMLGILGVGVPYYRARRWMLEQRTSEGSEWTRDMLLRLHTGAPPERNPLVGSCSALRSQIHEELAELDVVASTTATAAAGGWPTVVYRDRVRVPGTVILSQRLHTRDHLAYFAQTLVQRIRQEGIPATLAEFFQDPRILRIRTDAMVHDHALDLEDLARHHGRDRLIFVSNEIPFFDPRDDTLCPWVEALDVWPLRVLLTPDPLDGPAEPRLALLRERGFAVFPATREGVEALGQWLRDGENPRHATACDSNPPCPPLLRTLAFRRATTPPSWFNRWLLLQQLRQYLGRQGYAWLGAAAVAPFLHPVLTSVLGNHVGMPGSSFGLVWNRLVQLPWFRSDGLPSWLRLPLLMRLSWSHLTRTREVITLHIMLVPHGAEDEEGVMVVKRPGEMGFFGRLFRKSPGQPGSSSSVLVARETSWMANLFKFRMDDPLLQGGAKRSWPGSVAGMANRMFHRDGLSGVSYLALFETFMSVVAIFLLLYSSYYYLAYYIIIASFWILLYSEQSLSVRNQRIAGFFDCMGRCFEKIPARALLTRLYGYYSLSVMLAITFSLIIYAFIVDNYLLGSYYNAFLLAFASIYFFVFSIMFIKHNCNMFVAIVFSNIVLISYYLISWHTGLGYEMASISQGMHVYWYVSNITGAVVITMYNTNTGRNYSILEHKTIIILYCLLFSVLLFLPILALPFLLSGLFVFIGPLLVSHAIIICSEHIVRNCSKYQAFIIFNINIFLVFLILLLLANFNYSIKFIYFLLPLAHVVLLPNLIINNFTKVRHGGYKYILVAIASYYSIIIGFEEKIRYLFSSFRSLHNNFRSVLFVESITHVANKFLNLQKEWMANDNISEDDARYDAGRYYILLAITISWVMKIMVKSTALHLAIIILLYKMANWSAFFHLLELLSQAIRIIVKILILATLAYVFIEIWPIVVPSRLPRLFME